MYDDPIRLERRLKALEEAIESFKSTLDKQNTENSELRQQIEKLKEELARIAK